MSQDAIKHLEFIQANLTRMANNSFLLKGWTVTVTAALFALAATNTRPAFAFLALFPATAFWGLDAYYLRRERLFRRLYDAVRRTPAAVEPYSMATEPYANQVASWLNTLLAPTVVGLHGVVVAVVVVIGLFFLLRP